MILLAAIAGDMLGSSYEFHNFSGAADDLVFFPAGSSATDDSILTCAVAQSLLDARTADGAVDDAVFAEKLPAVMRRMALSHPEGRYGGRFSAWLRKENAPAYGSLGNGSAMRVSPCAWTGASLGDAGHLAELSALPTHNHRLGVMGAVAAVTAICRMKEGPSGREKLLNEWNKKFSALGPLPDIERLEAPIEFDATSPGTVPIAVALALASRSWEETVRRAVAMGGDCDTTAAIAGAVAGGASSVPPAIVQKTLSLLPEDLKRVVTDFEAAFGQDAALWRQS